MKIENLKELPFTFDDNNLIQSVMSLFKFASCVIPVYQVIKYDKHQMHIYDYTSLKNALQKNIISIEDISGISVSVSIFNNYNNLEIINNIIEKTMGIPDYTYNLFMDICDDLKGILNKDLYLYSDVKTIDELFAIGDDIYLDDEIDIDDIHIQLNRRIESLFAALNAHIDEIEHLASSYYEDIGFIFHQAFSMINLTLGNYDNILLDNKVIGNVVRVKTGATFFFNSGNEFNKWTNTSIKSKEEKNKMDTTNMQTLEEGYICSYNKAGTPIYYKLENGKKVRISKEEAMKHMIEIPTEESNETKIEAEEIAPAKTKKVRHGRRITKQEDTSNETVDANEETPKVNSNVKLDITPIDTSEIPTENVQQVTSPSYITAGDKTCYMYFDLALTERSRKATIISLALTTYDGKTFYGEFTDFVKTPNTNEDAVSSMIHPNSINSDNATTIFGNREEVGSKLKEWLAKHVDPNKFLQFVTDDAPYKFVMLMDLIENFIGDNVSKTCIDLNQDIATSITRINNDPNISDEEFNKNFVPAIEAYHIDRLGYVTATIEDLSRYDDTFKKTTLFKVILTKAIHQFLWNL